jgi:3-hydroxyisobutyrate dehydrogenase-like beta-hydroxyacid dehydrogenase
MDLTRASIVGLIHPGEMGAAVGRCLTAVGQHVVWASQDRSEATAARARAAGLADAGSVTELIRRADVVVSVCPPHAALDVARAARGFGGLYLDANAISPATAAQVAAVVDRASATYVDGGIIGPPPVAAGTTRLYLSGEQAGLAAALFDGTALDARVVPAGPFAASGLKMAYAAWTKGSAALLLAARELAEAEGVGDALHAEWALSQPDLAARYRGAAAAAAAKGWRWVGEMREIAATMERAGLPAGFHLAAAEIFGRCS